MVEVKGVAVTAVVLLFEEFCVRILHQVCAAHYYALLLVALSDSLTAICKFNLVSFAKIRFLSVIFSEMNAFLI